MVDSNGRESRQAAHAQAAGAQPPLSTTTGAPPAYLTAQPLSALRAAAGASAASAPQTWPRGRGLANTTATANDAEAAAAAEAMAARPETAPSAALGGTTPGLGQPLQAPAPPFHQWRVRERMRTSNAVLVLCLNVGVDPPDVVKPKYCARTECWINPGAEESPQVALRSIGVALQKQYETWQPRAKYKVAGDPTIADLRRVCTSLRRNAKDERLLFHYNGHGVPKPTRNGEIWVFSRDYTQYIPLVLYELQDMVGSPSLYVFDCNCAGLVVSEFLKFAEGREPDGPRNADNPAPTARHQDAILLAACQAEELLPTDAELPADLFTCCLTTPIKAHLRWFMHRSIIGNLTPDMLDRIPGKLNDRATPLGELNWIFTAVTDTIAWHVLPRETFKRLFRQDLLLASVMRNFLLADRIMRSVGCVPVSHPTLPRTHDHPLWDIFDHTIEQFLVQLPGLSGKFEVDGARDEATRLMREADLLWGRYSNLFDSYQSQGSAVSANPTPLLDSVQLFRENNLAGSVVLHSGEAAYATGEEAAGPSHQTETDLAVKSTLDIPGDGVDREQVAAVPGISVTSFPLAASDGQLASTRPMHDMGGNKVVSRLFPRMHELGRHVEKKRDAFSAKDAPSNIQEVEEARVAWLHAFGIAKNADHQCKSLERKTQHISYVPIPFFQGQMSSFAVWLKLGPAGQSIPLQLPILLQVLLSQTFRVDALRLLSRYLQTGPDAVDLALSVGYFPYVLKLLQSPIPQLKQELVFIWGKIMALDQTTCLDLVKDQSDHGAKYFADFLDCKGLADGEEPRPVYLVMAAFVLSVVAKQSPETCKQLGVVQICHRRLFHPVPIVRRWACLCMDEVLTRSWSARVEALASDILLDVLYQCATCDDAPDVRAAAVLTLYTLLTESLALVRVPDSSYLDLHSGQSGFAESGADLHGLDLLAGLGISSGDAHDTQFVLQHSSPSESHSLPSSESDSSQPHVSTSINLYHRACRLFSALARDDASALVRREVSIALSRIAETRPDMFRRGQRLSVWSEFPIEGQSVCSSLCLTDVDLTCKELFVGLRTLAFDPHPIVSSYAYSSLTHIVDDVLSPRCSVGGCIDQGLSETRQDAISFGLSSSGGTSGSHVLTNSLDSLASAGLGASSPPTVFHTPMLNPLNAVGPGNLSFLPASDAESRHVEHVEARTSDCPSLSTPSFLRQLPRTSGSSGMGGVQSGVRPEPFPPVGLGIADSASGLPRAVHVRSASGSFNFAKIENEIGSLDGAEAPTRRGDVQSRTRTAIRQNATNDAMRRCRSTGSRLPSPTIEQAAPGSVPRSLPLYPIALASGVGKLIRTVSQSFIFGLKLGGSIEESGDADGGDSSLSRKSSLSNTSASGDRTGASKLRDGGESCNILRVGSRLSSSMQPPRRASSYQVLNKLASPPLRSSSRLPMPRTNSFLVGLTGSDSYVEKFRRSSRPVVPLDRALMTGSEPVVDAARSLHAWSVDCIPLLVFDSDSQDCMREESSDVQAGYKKLGYKFGAPPTASGDELAEAALDSGQRATEDGLITREDPNTVNWTKPIYSKKMAAAGGSVLSIVFLPRGVGYGTGPLVVTGDSRGGIGVYDHDTWECQASLGIPGPAGSEDAGVAALLSLNSPVSPSAAIAGNHPYESAMILAGSVDGRVAIFKSDMESSLREGRYSIVSTFQASGVSCDGDRLSRLRTVGSMVTSQPRSIDHGPQLSMLDFARKEIGARGNGLVLAYERRCGRLFAGGCQTGAIRNWDLRTERSVQSMIVFEDPSSIVTGLTGMKHLGAHLCAFGGSDGSVGWVDWRVSASVGYSIRSSGVTKLGEHQYPVISMSICPSSGDGLGDDVHDLFVSADLGGDVLAWDMRMNSGPVGRMHSHTESVLTTMTTHPTSRIIATGSAGHCVQTFGPQYQTTGMILTGEGLHAKRKPLITALAFQPDAQLLAVGCADSTVMLYGRR
jgi:Raptor N-terminal CASPase like domain